MSQERKRDLFDWFAKELAKLAKSEPVSKKLRRAACFSRIREIGESVGGCGGRNSSLAWRCDRNAAGQKMKNQYGFDDKAFINAVKASFDEAKESSKGDKHYLLALVIGRLCYRVLAMASLRIAKLEAENAEMKVELKGLKDLGRAV